MYRKPSGVLTFTRMSDGKTHMEIVEEYYKDDKKEKDKLDKLIEEKIRKILKEKS